ncbi:EAL domain-containing protein [Marinobacter halodurans]|uniref:EAL domain-containing protein n=1 Tax=Marinobacter halodurans TaxID=2528979 RepID=A0ABY1ZPK9_9GAMM|nr:EAL domain-containing protein [Marinobacter halodurans]TBW58787.1 EAL domain-containing protein [Marinobacter halodurans]
MADPHTPRDRYRIWLPLALFLLLGTYGYLVNLTPTATSEATSPVLPPLLPTASTEPVRSPVSYTLASLDQVLADRSWHQDAGWQTLAPTDNGLGYLDGPATFRVRLDNPTAEAIPLLLDIQAPSLDQVRATRITGDGTPHTLPTLGDRFPFRDRLVDLPSLIWPLRLAPRSQETLLFEVVNAGPTLFPLHLSHPEHLLSDVGSVIAWKAAIYGVLVFALVFDLALLLTLRSMAAAWLTCLLASILFSQLCVDGFGLWLVWPHWPVLGNLLTPMLALGAVALLGFARHFLHLTGRATLLCQGTAAILLLLALVAPLRLPLVGQGTVLLAGSATLALVLGLSLLRWRSSAAARHLTIALLLLMAGAAISMARTVGWIPVNSLTSSGFYLGTGAAAVFLTLVVGYRLVEERRRRLNATLKVVEERRLRARLEQDYHQLMVSHRVTGRPDRSAIEQTLDQLTASHAPFVVGLLRLERYGEIERALGYQEAESLLRKYLAHLSRFLEATFPRQLVLFRGHPLGTVDTFNHVIALRTDVDSIPWNDVRTWLEQAFSEDHYAFSWMARLGLAYAPEHGSSGSELISRAGFAALSTDVTINVYDPYTERKQNLQHFLILDLDRALRTGGIQLHYQPKICLQNDTVIAYEALIRWQHPEYGAITPGQWIPFAEQVGAIHGVTLWAIERAAQDLAALEHQSGCPVTVSVNISARDLARTDFHGDALAILARHRVSPQRLMLEITETAVMRDVDQARQTLEKLSHAGFRIALDDFGTGYSSLSALATFNLDELKIDRSFLTDIPTDAVRQRIFHAAVELGEALGLRIVVEGVESEAVAQWLRRYPGLCGQGYFWGRPAPLASSSVSGYDAVQSD